MGLSEWADLVQGGRVWGLAAALEFQNWGEGRAIKTVLRKLMAWAGKDGRCHSISHPKRIRKGVLLYL